MTSQATCSAGADSPQYPRVPPKKARTRNRLIKVCLECRNQKAKCDKVKPICGSCAGKNQPCNYVPEDVGHERFNQVKEGVRALERSRHDYVRRIQDTPSEDSLSFRRNSSGSGPEDDGYLQPTPREIADATLYHDTDYDGFNVDLGFQVGKFHGTDRIGAYCRPEMAEEISEKLDQTTPLSVRRTSKQVYSRPSTFTLGSTYIAPQSNFFFSDGLGTSMEDCYVNRFEADSIIMFYWVRVHLVARTLHRPSFERLYDTFFQGIASDSEVSVPSQALIYSALFAGLVSMAEQDCLACFQKTKQAMLEKIQLGAETLLSRAHVSRTRSLTVLQAFVTYLVPLCRGHIGSTHVTLITAIIRIAQCMGIHRDSRNSGVPAVNAQIARMLWHQLCYLDIRAFEAQGPRAIIRLGEFTAPFPLNVDDEDLENDLAPDRDENRWTEMSLSKIRMECNEAIRRIYVEREHLDRGDGRITLMTMLQDAHRFRQYMEYTWFPRLDPNIAAQHLARLIIILHTNRMHAMILHHCHLETTTRMPPRLREGLLDAGLQIMETVMKIEISVYLNPWQWYASALQQHHYALFMLVDVFMDPHQKNAPRIRACLDWVFEPPMTVSDICRPHWILTEVMIEMRNYNAAKAFQCSAEMDTNPVISRQMRSEYQISNQFLAIPESNHFAHEGSSSGAVLTAPYGEAFKGLDYVGFHDKKTTQPDALPESGSNSDWEVVPEVRGLQVDPIVMQASASGQTAEKHSHSAIHKHNYHNMASIQTLANPLGERTGGSLVAMSHIQGSFTDQSCSSDNFATSTRPQHQIAGAAHQSTLPILSSLSSIESLNNLESDLSGDAGCSSPSGEPYGCSTQTEEDIDIPRSHPSTLGRDNVYDLEDLAAERNDTNPPYGLPNDPEAETAANSLLSEEFFRFADIDLQPIQDYLNGLEP